MRTAWSFVWPVMIWRWPVRKGRGRALDTNAPLARVVSNSRLDFEKQPDKQGIVE